MDRLTFAAWRRENAKSLRSFTETLQKISRLAPIHRTTGASYNCRPLLWQMALLIYLCAGLIAPSTIILRVLVEKKNCLTLF